VPETARRALEGWLTAQQVRLRVHSKESLKQHAKVLLLHPFGNAAKVVKAKLGGSQSQSQIQSEFSRFHSEHESAKRPEYATALNNFMRVLHPDSPLSPELKEYAAVPPDVPRQDGGNHIERGPGRAERLRPARSGRPGMDAQPADQ
jgi:hypothetical protein